MVKVIPPSWIIESETDLDGYITYANNYFEMVVEYDKDLMLGFKHNVIRADDMPEHIFDEMWSTITENKTWTGIVKNQTFNGKKYYWVKAVIKPLMENGKKIGYKSIRRQATDIEIENVMKTYGIDYD